MAPDAPARELVEAELLSLEGRPALRLVVRRASGKLVETVYVVEIPTDADGRPVPGVVHLIQGAGEVYTVTAEPTGSCDCPDSQFARGVACKHRLGLERVTWLGLEMAVALCEMERQRAERCSNGGTAVA